MQEMKQIFDLLEDKQTSELIYTIFVYGSKDGFYFRQSDLEEIFSSPDSGGNGNIRLKLKSIENLFIIKKKKIHFHKYDGCGMPLLKENNFGWHYYDIKWSNKTTTRGVALVPTFNWLEKLYKITLTQKQKEELFKYFQVLSMGCNKENKQSKFPCIGNSNLLKILLNAIELNYLLKHLGKSFFGDNFENARSELRAERRNFTTGENYDKKFNAVCKKYGVKLNKYNEDLITQLMIFDYGIMNDFPKIKLIVPNSYLVGTPDNPLLYSISDILMISFYANKADYFE